MGRTIDASVYDQDILNQGLQHQIDTYFEPKDKASQRRINIVLKALDPRPNEHVLDAGCGVGTFAFHAARLGAITTGIDYSAESVKVGNSMSARYNMKDRMALVTGNALALPFADKTFDKVVSADFIEHITDEEKDVFCAEILRVLKPGGIFVIFTPNLIRERIGDGYWYLRHLCFGDRIPVTDLHYGLISRLRFELILKKHRVLFRFFYADTTRPWLARLPFLRRFLSLNLVWIGSKPHGTSHR